MNRAKQLGTLWETAIVTYLRDQGWPHAERRALSGSSDRGDIAGIAGVCIEAKNTGRIVFAEFLSEAETEKVNASATVGVAWIKRRGKASAADGYVLMSGGQFVGLLKEAGY